MSIKTDIVSHVASGNELQAVQDILDSFDANLNEHSLERYFSAKNAAIVYVTEQLAADPDWDWPAPGAIRDIVIYLRRSMETQTRTQAPSKQELLTEAYLMMTPAANKLAA